MPPDDAELVLTDDDDKVFSWILMMQVKEGLLKGKTVGGTATTSRANAA